MLIMLISLILKFYPLFRVNFLYWGVACSRRSDSGARAKNKASERAGKKRGETREEDVLVLFPSLPSFFSRSFARSSLSERLEQANWGVIFPPIRVILSRVNFKYPN